MNMKIKSSSIGCLALILSSALGSCSRPSSSEESSLNGLPPLDFFPPITKVENRGGVPFEVYKNWTFEDWCLAGRGKYLRNPLPANQQASVDQLSTVGSIRMSLGASLDRDVIKRNPELPFADKITAGMLTSQYIAMAYGEYNDYTVCHVMFEYSRRDPLIKGWRINFSEGNLSEFGPLYSLKRDESFILADMDGGCVTEVLNDKGHCYPNDPAHAPVPSIPRIDVLRQMAKSRYQVQAFPSHPKITYADGSPVKHFRFLDDGYDVNARWFKPKLAGISLNKNQHIAAVLHKKRQQRLDQIAALPLAEQTAAYDQELFEKSRCYLPEFIDNNIECGWSR